MKISELFESYKDEVFNLFEHLGNLDVVDKKFLDVMKTVPKYDFHRSVKTTTYQNRMPVVLGRKSKVDSVEVKSGAEAYRQLVDETEEQTSTARAIIVNTNNEQVFAAFKVQSDNGGTNFDYIWVADLAQLLSHVKDSQQRQEAEEILTNAKIVDYDQGNNFTHGPAKQLYSALTALLKVTKMGGNKAVQVFVLHIDQERLQSKQDRIASRKISSRNVTEPQSGRRKDDPHQLSAKFLEAAKATGIPNAEELAKLFRKDNKSKDEYQQIKDALTSIETHYSANGKKSPLLGRMTNDFNFIAKKALEYRLADYKTNFAKQVSTPEEMIKLLKEKGFLDKIKINGILYKIGSNSFQLDKLKKNEPDSSYIEYSAETWDDSTYQELMDNLKEIIPMMTSNEEKQKELMKKYRPPYSIKVFLKLEKSSIVIDRIESEKWFKKLDIR